MKMIMVMIMIIVVLITFILTEHSKITSRL